MRKKTQKRKILHHNAPRRSKEATLKKGAEIFVKKFSPIIKKLANE